MKNLLKLTSLCLLAGLVACTHPAWEEHYSSVTGNVIDKTLKQALKEDPEVSQFVSYLEEVDYLDVLGHAQSYTVWAPTNDAWASFDASDKRNLLQTLKNHISRYPYLTADVRNEAISLRLMDNKRLDFSFDGEDFYFGSKKLIVKDQAYKNGILHKIEGYEPYVKNIYEYIQLTPGYEDIAEFLDENLERTFDESASLVIGVVNGETVYDSVFVEYNYIEEDYLPGISKEESDLTMLLPSKTAWDRLYQAYAPYVKVRPFDLPLPITGLPERNDVEADSLQDLLTKIFILKHLLFQTSMTMEEIQQKVGPVYTMPAYDPVRIGNLGKFFEGAYGYTELSNGVVYTTDSLPLSPASWSRTHVFEAEDFRNHYYIPNTWVAYPDSLAVAVQEAEIRTRNLYERDSYRSTVYNDSISGNHYLEVLGRSLFLSPTVTFDLTTNSLSNMDYNIYVVFLPNKLYNNKIKDEDLKPVPLNFSVSYVSEEGSLATRDYRTARYTNPTCIDTLLVTAEADGVTPRPIRLPYQSSLLTLKLNSLIQAEEDSIYSRDMLIDCIILEPVIK